ncbi:MAG TPA: hypothetical protein VGG09_14805 [Acidimicrobiales bacterium]|jgi:hypothetical protein
MGSTKWVAEVWLETAAGVGDLRGRGTVHMVDGAIGIAVRPRGLAGFLVPTREKRFFLLAQVREWETSGSKIEFTCGAIALQSGGYSRLPATTTGHDVPVHICHLTCRGPDEVMSLTDAAIADGLMSSRVSRRS